MNFEMLFENFFIADKICSSNSKVDHKSMTLKFWIERVVFIGHILLGKKKLYIFSFPKYFKEIDCIFKRQLLMNISCIISKISKISMEISKVNYLSPLLTLNEQAGAL